MSVIETMVKLREILPKARILYDDQKDECRVTLENMPAAHAFAEKLADIIAPLLSHDANSPALHTEIFQNKGVVCIPGDIAVREEFPTLLQGYEGELADLAKGNSRIPVR